MDTPFRVERSTRLRGEYSSVSSWAIMRNQEALCWIDDVTFAYRLVDLLNEDEWITKLTGQGPLSVDSLRDEIPSYLRDLRARNANGCSPPQPPRQPPKA